MEETALPYRSSTLAPPPLETAASGTRALQRFDLGRTRLQRDVAQAPRPADKIVDIGCTVKMSVSPNLKNLPPVEESVPRTITLPILGAPRRTILDAYAEPATLPTPPRSGALLREVAWALTASASLFGMSSVASAVVYVLLFP